MQLVPSSTYHTFDTPQAMSDCDKTGTLVGLQAPTHDAHCIACDQHQADVVSWINKTLASSFAHPLLMYSVAAVLAKAKSIVSAAWPIGYLRPVFFIGDGE